MFKTTAPLAPLFAALLFAGCSDDPPPATGNETAAPSASAGDTPVTTTQAAPKPGIALLAAGGEPTLRVEAHPEGGYRLRGEGDKKVGKIKVEADRVKVKAADGQALGKVKKKDGAFKVYGPDDATLFKAKRKDGKLKINSDSGEELGKLKGGTLTWKGQAITATSEGDVVVVNGPSGPLKLRGITPERAVWLGVPDLSQELKLAIVVFLRDVGF
jgi:hypothetical protein